MNARRFSGWHMSAIFMAFFAVVIAVNFGMAWTAVHGFGGVVVQNSYVASQDYNRWIAEQRREDALGWSATVSRDADGRLVVAPRGVPAGALVTASLRRPIGQPEDRVLVLQEAAPGRFVGPAIPPGRWIVRIEVAAGGKAWSHEAHIG